MGELRRSSRTPDLRSEEAQQYRRLYATPRWRALRAQQLRLHPLCATCLAQGRVTLATVADHIRPHKGNTDLFFEPSNLQSLCDQSPFRCHSSAKQSEERLGYSKAVGLDGWPIDPRHPASRD